MIVDDFVEFENNSRVLEYKYHYKDVLLWPYIRAMLIRKVINVKYGLVTKAGYSGKRNKYRDYLKYNTFRLPKSDILFFATSTAFVESGGQIYDRLIDDFMKLVPDNSAKLILHNLDFDIRKLEKAGYPFSLDNFINEIISYEGERKKHKVPIEELEVIEGLIEYLKKDLPFEVEEGVFEAIRKSAKTLRSCLPYYYKYYKKLIDLVQPKLAIFHAGIAGRPQIRVFNDYGIVTAEYQHGTIDRQWLYRYGKRIAEDVEYRKHMPNYMLTWGKYWTSSINLPADVYQIGNPTVQNSIDKFDETQTEDDSKFNILLVTGDDYEWCVEFISYVLANLLEDYKIIIKLHPLLQDHARYYKTFLQSNRVEIGYNGSIYDYFAKCHYVVGDMSTALYEAAAVGKEVFIMYNNELTRSCMNGGFGTWIQNGRQFIEKISENRDKENKFNKEDFFASNWKENYINFLNKII